MQQAWERELAYCYFFRDKAPSVRDKGQDEEFRDCPGRSGTLGNYVICVCLTVGGTMPGHCDKHSSFSGASNNFSYWQQFQWSSSALVFLISLDQLIALDNVISAYIYLLNNSPHYHLPIQLHVDSLSSGITEDDLLEGLIELLTWVCSVCEQFICSYDIIMATLWLSLLLQAKSYVHVHRRADDNDRGYVSISYSLYATRLHVEDMKAHYCCIALLCAFAFLNILMPIALAKSLSWYYPRVRAVDSGQHFTACLYWAAALIAFLCDIIYTENSLYRHYYHNQPFITSCIVERSGHKCSLLSDTRLYKDEVFTLMSKITIIPIAVFAEVVVSVHATRHHVIGRQYGRRRCFCLHQTIHVLALWNILILLQIFTMCAIPLCVLLLTHPQVTFLCWAMFAMMPVGLTLVVAYLMYQCQKSRRRKCYCNIRHCGYIMVVHFTMIISAV